MDIRRIDPDLIAPAPASEHGTRVAINRRPGDSREQRHGKHPPPEDDEPQTTPEPPEESKPATVYDPEGHVQDREEQSGSGHAIDFRA